MGETLALTDEAVLRNPFPAYKWLRDNAPIYKDPVSGVYIVSRYDDIKAIAEDPATFSNQTGMLAERARLADDEASRILRECAAPHIDTIVSADPPVHTAYRSIVQGSFGAARITRMMGYIQEVCDAQVLMFADKGRCEVLGDLAIPMPMYIIADQLGVPRERYETFKRWSDALLMVADLRQPADVRADCAHSVVEMHDFLREMAQHYRAAPTDNVLCDIVAGEIDGRKLTDDEVISIASQILVAGNETTTNTMTMGLHLMIEQGLEGELRADLSKIPQFVEEVLRLTTALQGLFRRTTRDVVVHGVAIPANATVMLRWAAANRDERRFPDPDRIDLDRRLAMQHMTFGMGIHYCLGQLLARAELRVAFSTLLTRFRNFRLADEPGNPGWIVHAFARGMSRLVVEFDHA
jgi:cytochrome P450